MTTAYDTDKISHYLLQITAGRGRGIKSHKLTEKLDIQTVKKWDGKEGPKQQVIEEEFDLADIMGDDEL